MRHLLLGRTLLGTTVLAGSLTLTATAATAAPPVRPRHHSTPAPKAAHPHPHPHMHHATRAKAHQPAAGKRRDPAPAPSTSPSPSPSPTVLGPVAPARHVLSGSTLGATSYAAAAPVDLTAIGVRAPATRPRAPYRPVTWPPHGHADWPAVTTSVRAAVHHPTAPLLVGTLIGLFLLVQNSIDRSDPKLAGGHRNDPPDLRFGPVIRTLTSEVTAP